jgi:phosphoserine phosphatase
MKLADTPGKDARNVRAAIANLPPDVLDQVVHAFTHDTHSTRQIVEWLRAEGYDEVSAGAFDYYFRNRELRRGQACGKP